MGAIVLDTIKVNSYVLPNVDKSEKAMQEAYSTVQSLKNALPSTFSKRSMVNDIASQLYNIKKEINDVETIISKKVDRVNKIENKADSKKRGIASAVSKIGAVAGTIGGAAVGAASGGLVGAAVGGVVGNKVGKTVGKAIYKTGAKVVKYVTSGVKKIFTGIGNFFKKTASKIAEGIKSIWQKFSGAIKNIGSKVVEATKKIGKAIYKTGAKVVKNAVSKIKSFGSKIADGFKKIGSAIKSGVKTAAKWVGNAAKTAGNWVADKLKKAKNWVCKAAKDTGAWICKAGKTIWNGLKSAWNWVTNGDNWKRLGASIANAVLSFAKGVVSVIEAIGDVALLAVSAIATVGTAIYDVGKGLCTGNWDWSATNGLWDGTKSMVSYNWTNALDESLGWRQYLDQYAYEPFKSDGIVCQISEGIGYVAGVIAITVVTFGSATPLLLATTATAAGIGKYTSEEWNKNSLTINYNGNDMDLAIDYHKYKEIEELKEGQSTTIKQQLIGADGKPVEVVFTITKIGNTYSIKDSEDNDVEYKGMKESDTAKGLLVGTVKGAWEGAQYYVGGKIGQAQFTSLTSKMASPVTKTIARSTMRVGLDMATGVAEVPFQSAVTMLSEGKSWEQAWTANGGWDAVVTQAGIAGVASFAGEAFSFKGNLGTEKVNTALLTGDAQLVKNTLENANPKHISNAMEILSEKQLKTIVTSDTFHSLDNVTKSNLLDNLDNKKLINLLKDADISEVNKKEILNNLSPKKLSELEKIPNGLIKATDTSVVKEADIVDTKNIDQVNPNSISKYKFKFKEEIKIADDLKLQGYSDEQLTDFFARKASEVADIKAKRQIEDFTYEYLVRNGHTSENAANMIAKAQINQLNLRGVTTVAVDSNGIKYNLVNGFNSNNQAYDLDYVLSEIDKLPDSVKSKIKEINIYDTNNPYDKYWSTKYNTGSSKYFSSAATAGDGTINIWANNKVTDTVLAHEAGHCLDVGRVLSSSDEYAAAMKADFELNGKLAITEYGKNDVCEDFADSLAAYIKGKNGTANIDDFPNRKAYFDKLFGEDGSALNVDSTSKIDVSSPLITTTNSITENLDNITKSDLVNIDDNQIKNILLDDAIPNMQKQNVLKNLSSEKLYQFKDTIGDVEFLKVVNSMDDNTIFELAKVVDDDTFRLMKNNLTDAQQKTLLKTTRSKELDVLDFYNKNHPNEYFSTFEQLKEAHPNDVKAITLDEYRLKVLEDKVKWSTDKSIDKLKLERAKSNYELDPNSAVKSWEELNATEVDEYVKKVSISDSEYAAIYETKYQEAIDISNNTINTIDKMILEGKIKSGYSTDDVIRMIEDNVDQTTYLSDEYVRDLITKNFDPEGKGVVKVIAFQNGDPGANNFIKFEGKIGSKDGMFVMPEHEAKRILEECTVNGVIDSKKMTEALGGVPLGDNIVMIEQTVNVSDIVLPKGNLSSAYLGDWVPGGYTSNGVIEGIVQQNQYGNSNVNIVGIKGYSTDDYHVDYYVKYG